MILDKVLAHDSFWMVNKFITKSVGIESALILADLISKHKFFDDRGELDEDGFFFNTSVNIEESTTFTYHIQKQAILKLKEVGFLETKLKGIPAKLHFKIVEYKILNFLNTGFQEIQKLDSKKVETNNNKPNNNKSIKPDSLFEEQKIENIPEEVLKYLNQERLRILPDSKGYKVVKSNMSEIVSRVKEKFKLADFKLVVDASIVKWGNDTERVHFIRPETLFGKKFNSYLAEAPVILKNTSPASVSGAGSGNFVYAPSDQPNFK